MTLHERITGVMSWGLSCFLLRSISQVGQGPEHGVRFRAYEFLAEVRKRSATPAYAWRSSS